VDSRRPDDALAPGGGQVPTRCSLIAGRSTSPRHDPVVVGTMILVACERTELAASTFATSTAATSTASTKWPGSSTRTLM